MGHTFDKFRALLHDGEVSGEVGIKHIVNTKGTDSGHHALLGGKLSGKAQPLAPGGTDGRGNLNHHDFIRVAFPQQVDGGMGGQLIEPCGKPALPPEIGQPLPCGEKRLLGYLIGVRLVAAHAQGKAEHLVPIGCHQLLKGIGVSPPGARNDVFLILHFKSLLMPAVTRYTSSMVFIRTIWSL